MSNKDSAPQSRTTTYKILLQNLVKNSTGKNISREKAWGLFKDIMNSTTEFVLKDPEHTLPLSGVGKFKVMMSKPRPTVGTDGQPVPPKEGEFTPRFRFYPSSRVQNAVKEYFATGSLEALGAPDLDAEEVVEEEEDLTIAGEVEEEEI